MVVALLELEASSTMTGASITGSASEPAFAVVANATSAATVKMDFISSPRLCDSVNVTLNIVIGKVCWIFNPIWSMTKRKQLKIEQ